MTKGEFIQELASLLMMEDPEALKPDVELQSLSTWDSTAVLGIIVLLEERVGVSGAESSVPKCKTVAEIVAIAGDRLE